MGGHHKVMLRTIVILIVFVIHCHGNPITFLGQTPFQCYTSSSQDTGLFLYQFYAVETSTLSPAPVQYVITAGNDQELFRMNSTNGVISSALPLGVAEHSLVVQAVASDGDVAVASLVIHVVFALTQSLFEHDRYSISIAEDIGVRTRISVVRVYSDAAMVTVSIASGDPQGDLILEPASGLLSVSRPLDHETTPIYNIIVQVQDGGTRNNATVVVMVADVNDETPTFDSSFYDVVINEGLPPGSVVTMVTATDNDEGSNGHIIYSLQGDSAIMATFEVDASTGAIRNLVTLDYEVYRQYQLVVTASDHGNMPLSSETSVLITLRNLDDTCPQFTSSQYEVELTSETLSTSMVPLKLVTVEAFDPDNFTTIQYAIVGGNTDNLFQINITSGRIVLLQMDGHGYYLLNVTTTDLTCTTHMLVTISLANTNLHRPVFNTSTCQAELRENPSIGTHVTTVLATDDDAGRFGQLTYSFLVPTDLFALNETTGVIVTKLSPNSGVYDRESVNGFELGVLATDGGGLQGFCEMWVALIDVNDNKPMFVANGYDVGIATPSSIGQFVVQVSANDRDMGNYGNVTYFINDTNVPFAVDIVTGVVTVSNSLANQDYRFHVIARDQDDPPLSSSIVVQVAMPTGDIPVFTDCSYTISMETNDTMCVYAMSVAESTRGSIGITIATISLGNLVVYQALRGPDYQSNSEGTLIVDTNSGVVGVNSSAVLDYERLSPGPYHIQFLVTALVLGTGNSAINIALVIVNVTDLDDVAPQFPSLLLFASVRENANTTTRVTMITAHDPDSGIFGLVSYSLGNHNDDFAINASTGVITTLRSFDAETQFNFSVIVRAVSNGRTTAASLTISVDDVNDSPPYFNQSVYNISVMETSAVLSRLYQFSVIDLDRSDRGKHIYSIAGGDNDGTFSVTRSGDLLLQQLLDYDNSNRRDYQLIIHVSDGIFSDETVAIINIINVDDEPPVFIPNNYSVVLSEEVDIDTIVLQLTASDVDSDSIIYHLTGLANGRLFVDDSGAVRASKLDREEFPWLQFLAFAIGEEGCIAVAMVTIQLTDINDNPPIWLHPLVVTSLNENLSTQRSLVTVQARDPDNGRNGTVSYHLATGEDRFTIDSTTGELLVIQPIDREETPLVSVMVTARDDGTPMRLSSHIEVLIEILDVNDNDPLFPYPYMFARLFEDSPIGHTLLYIPAVDMDTGTNAAIQFILDTDNSDNCFTVNSTTGEVKLACSRDYENPVHQRSTLHISIADMGMLSRTSTTMATLEIQLLDSNDNAPIPSTITHQISLAENTPIGTLIVTVNSTDFDDGVNAELTYSVANCNILFDVVTQGNSGLLMLSGSLDYETSDVHQIEIIVLDNGTPQLFASVSVTIDVMDVNDNPPEFSQSVYSVTVPENIPIVTSLVQVVANDVDTGPGGMIDMYTIVAGNEEGYFTINKTTGLVGLQDGRGVGLDREQVDKHMLTIAATDKGNPLQLTGTSLVCVIVSDINDSPSYDGDMIVVVNALDGRFQAGYLGDVYVNDSDSSSILEGCVPVSGDLNILEVVDNCSLFLRQNDPMEAEYVLEVNGTSSGVTVTTNVLLMVQHITNTDQLLGITFRVSTEQYFQSFYSTLPQLIAELVDVSQPDIISISPNNGYTDVVIHGGNVQSLSDVSRRLFDARNEFITRNIPLVTIPIDVCYDGFCFNLGRCISSSSLSNSRISTVSYNFVYYSAHVIQERSCDCGYWATGSRCETVFDHCYSNPCQNGGICHNDITDYKCTCPNGTRGRDCSISDADCSNRDCLNGADCILGLGSSYCNCSGGYYGDNCEYAYFSDSNYCTPSPCRNGATCSAGRDGFTCHCRQGYSGLLCEESVVRGGGCVSNPCYHNSSCIDTTDDFICECSVGFTGPQCRWPLNECETRPCGVGGANCLAGRYGSYLCQCQAGYTGDDCSIANPCDLDPCENDGTCVEVANGYQCWCGTNYTGANCESEIDECDNELCLHNVSCHDNGIGCDCPLFAAGLYCEVFCPLGNTGERCEQQVDFCQSNQSICSNGGECRSTRMGAMCDCPPTHFGDRCELPCSNDICRNGGTCSPTPSTLEMCQCDEDFKGPQCELLTVSFMGSSLQPAYRAYDTLLFRSVGVISFRVATTASSGLLLLSIRWEGGMVMDFLSAEIIPGGHVSAKMSLGGGTAVAMATSNIIRVNDGQWHNVMIRVRSKELQVLVDYCTVADDEILPLTDCYDVMETTGNYSSLDLGLPLWLGGAPEIVGLSDGRSISSCISDVSINGELLDLEDYIAEHNSGRGCEQLDGCLSNPCTAEATCVAEWEGQQCFESEPVTFTGNGYARYTLLDDISSRKRQVDMEMAFYEDNVSLRVQTTQQEGLVYWMGGATDYAALELFGGNVRYRVDIGSGEAILVGGHISDGEWHSIYVRRGGLLVTMVIDDNNVNSTSLPGNSVIFNILSNEIYVGGREQSAILYNGCVDNIRFINKQLPTKTANEFASVEFIGDIPVNGCASGPCLSNPCDQGECQVVAMDTYQCICPNGEPCALKSSEDSISLYVYVAIGAGGIVFLLAVCIIAILLCYCCRSKQGKYIPDKPDHHEMYFADDIGTIGIGQEDGGGEQDIPYKDLVICNEAVTKRPATPEIVAIITSCKPEVDKEFTEVDSLRHFAYEGSDHGEGSMSSICSDDGRLLERLNEMGPPFEKLVDLLEHLEQDSDNDSQT